MTERARWWWGTAPSEITGESIKQYSRQTLVFFWGEMLENIRARPRCVLALPFLGSDAGTTHEKSPGVYLFFWPYCMAGGILDQTWALGSQSPVTTGLPRNSPSWYLWGLVKIRGEKLRTRVTDILCVHIVGLRSYFYLRLPNG